MNYELKGLYVITDNRLIDRNEFTTIVEKTLKGGAQMLQLREKNTEYDEIVYIGKELLQITKKYGVPLIINDHPEIAAKIGAQGVHLGETDSSIEEAKKILGKDAIVGVSCYGVIERGLEASYKGANYLAFGTPFQTPTKPGRKPTPFSVLTEAKLKLKEIPIFAIGGITKENVKDILATGVDGIAVITSVFGSSDPELASRELAAFF